jgi:hypothetical protein
MLRLIWWDLIGYPSFIYLTPCKTNELLVRLVIVVSGFGINVISELRSCSVNTVGLIIVHDKIIALIWTWSLTWYNSATIRVEWDAFGQVIRKASERLSYSKGASRECVVAEYREVLGSNCLESFSNEGFLCFLLPKSVAGFLELTELWKGLVALPCLVSSVEMNGKSRSLSKWVTRLVGKDAQPLQSVKLVYQPCSWSRSTKDSRMINVWN